MEKIKENVNFIFIIASIYIITLGKMFLTLTNMTLVSFSHLLYLICFIGIVIIIFNYLISKIKFKFSYIFIILLIILGIIATNNAIYKNVSLYGHEWRCEGLLSLISYYILFIVSTFLNKKNINHTIDIILYLGLFQIIIGLLQITNITINPFDGTVYGKGFEGNSNFFGTHNILCFGLASGLLLKYKNKKYIFLTLAYILGIIISGSMANFVGLLAIIIFELIYLFKNHKMNSKKLQKIIVIIGSVCIILFSILNIIYENKLYGDVIELISDSKSIIIDHKTDNKYGSYRLYIWKYSVKLLPKYWLRGTGIDNLMYVFPQENRIGLERELIVDKAHNEILQMAITEGIFAPIIYVSLIMYTLFKKSKNYTIHLKAAILGYFIQSLFNISVITVAPLYYIILGLCNAYGEKI